MKSIDEKIKKIVALIDGAATEGEARAASLALQRLLVANDLKLEDINLDDAPVEVGEEVCELGRRIPEWKKILAKVVANNYRCRVYTSYSEIRDLYDCRTKGRTAVFVGEGDDPVVASCCFRASANAAENCFRSYCARMKSMGYGSISRQKGVKGTWMLGFISGLKRAYEEQVSSDESLALAIVVPESVNRHMDGIGLKTTKIKVRTTSDPYVKADGYESGYGFGRGDRVSAASA